MSIIGGYPGEISEAAGQQTLKIIVILLIYMIPYVTSWRKD
jgi:ABC-type phosphate transport system permease subunit